MFKPTFSIIIILVVVVFGWTGSSADNTKNMDTKNMGMSAKPLMELIMIYYQKKKKKWNSSWPTSKVEIKMISNSFEVNNI